MARIKAEKRSEGPKRKVTHVRITKGANGFAVHHELERRRKAGTVGMGYGYDPDPKPNYFAGDNAKQDMLDHVGGLAESMGGDEPEAAPTQPA